MGFLNRVKAFMNADRDFGQLDKIKENDLKVKAREEYYKAKEKQTLRVAQLRAKIEADKRIKEMKQNTIGRRALASAQVQSLMSADEIRNPKKKKSDFMDFIMRS